MQLVAAVVEVGQQTGTGDLLHLELNCFERREIKCVQFMKNSSHHIGIGTSPFKAMFGVEAKVGLRPSTLPNEVIDMTETEEDLLRTCQSEDTSAEHRDAEPLQGAATDVISLDDLQASQPESTAEETAAEEDCSSSPHTTDIPEETDFTESQMDNPLEFVHGSPEWSLIIPLPT